MLVSAPRFKENPLLQSWNASAQDDAAFMAGLSWGRKRWDERLKGSLVDRFDRLILWEWLVEKYFDGKVWKNRELFCIGNQESKLKIQRNTTTTKKQMKDSLRSKEELPGI